MLGYFVVGRRVVVDQSDVVAQFARKPSGCNAASGRPSPVLTRARSQSTVRPLMVTGY